MAEREIAGVSYRIDKLDAMKQFHVARRLAPVMGKLAGNIGADKDADLFAMLGPVSEAVAEMRDEDANYVISTCLSVCSRPNPHGTGFSPVAAPNGRIMFQDVELPQMLQLVWAVIEENLGGFFAAIPSISAAPEAESQKG
jgi:hypothetical protein